MASASSARDSGAPAEGKDDDGRSRLVRICLFPRSLTRAESSRGRRARPRRSRYGRGLLKIAMLSPTSTLPRTTDAGGGITAGSTEVQASIDAYLGSAERVRVLADVVWKVGVALVAVLVLAWVLGVLPGAVRLL